MGSRALKPAEARYSVTEIELLASRWAVEKCAFWLKGLDSFTIETDHRCLVDLWAKELGDITNERIRKNMEKLQAFNPIFVYVGATNVAAADFLSRLPKWDNKIETTENEGSRCKSKEEAQDRHRMKKKIKACKIKKDDAGIEKMKAAIDAEYLEAVSAIRNGRKPTDFNNDDHIARKLSGEWNDLSLLDSDDKTIIIYDNDKIVVPKACRENVIRTVHNITHAGWQKTVLTIRQTFSWPGMRKQIRNICETCPTCLKHAKENPTEPEVEQTEELENIEVGEVWNGDVYHLAGDKGLALVDKVSGYLAYRPIKSEKSVDLIEAHKSIWATFGKPRTLICDNLTAFTSEEFKEAMAEMGIKISHSSPLNSRSNGNGERAVQAIKSLEKKLSEGMTKKEVASRMQEAVLAYNTMPRLDGSGAPSGHVLWEKDKGEQQPDGVLEVRQRPSRTAEGIKAAIKG